jgi:hypothetical protein
MNTPGNGQPRRYSVSMSKSTKARLKELHLKARDAGFSELFLTSLPQIIERLREDPTAFGEAWFRLPALKLVVYHAIVNTLVVDFAVHEDQALVFVNGFKLLS